jgi:hypothetical protein
MEIAGLIIATVSALLQGIDTWLAYRDARRARHHAQVVFQSTLTNPQTITRARVLVELVPKETLDRIHRKVNKCYDKFNEMLDNVGDKYFPDDVTEASTGALPYCVCDSLYIMKNVVGDLPDEELRDAWRKYNCDARIAQLGPRRPSGANASVIPAEISET